MYTRLWNSAQEWMACGSKLKYCTCWIFGQWFASLLQLVCHVWRILFYKNEAFRHFKTFDLLGIYNKIFIFSLLIQNGAFKSEEEVIHWSTSTFGLCSWPWERVRSGILICKQWIRVIIGGKFGKSSKTIQMSWTMICLILIDCKHFLILS